MSPAYAIETAPAYVIEEDVRNGVIKMTVQGFFDLETLRRHFDENDGIVRKWRSLGRPIRVLIDAVNLLPHTPEGQALVQSSTKRIYVPGDRVALLVGSNLVKMQMRRALTQGEVINFFVSANAAMTWLMAQKQSVNA